MGFEDDAQTREDSFVVVDKQEPCGCQENLLCGLHTDA
jgi:hypothetical protein